MDLPGPGGQHVVYGWSGMGLLDGGPLTFSDDELAERGTRPGPVLGPGVIDNGGGLCALETRGTMGKVVLEP